MNYDELDETSEDHARGLAPLITYFSKLIAKFREKNISAKNLMILAKAKYLLENMGKLNFEGGIRLDAGYKGSDGEANFYVCNIECDDVRLNQDGVEVFSDGLTESVSVRIYCLLDGNDYSESIQKIEDWIEGFEELSDNGKDFNTFDDVENISEIFIDEDNEEDGNNDN